MMQNVNVGQGETKLDDRVRGERVTVRSSVVALRASVVHGAVPMSMERKKVRKKQRRSKRIGLPIKVTLVAWNLRRSVNI
jgi:hypothetical protein